MCGHAAIATPRLANSIIMDPAGSDLSKSHLVIQMGQMHWTSLTHQHTLHLLMASLHKGNELPYFICFFKHLVPTVGLTLRAQ
ncbi:hypothetical protein MHYP_G00261430 [Metynnis hypsauchen]